MQQRRIEVKSLTVVNNIKYANASLSFYKEISDSSVFLMNTTIELLEVVNEISVSQQNLKAFDPLHRIYFREFFKLLFRVITKAIFMTSF